MIMILNSNMKRHTELNITFRKYISSKGMRNTSQREEIIKEIVSGAGHSTAEDIYNRLRAKNPKIGFATVYRNLKLLCDAGFLEEIKIGNEKARYELKLENSHHDHLICVKCGSFIEFYSKEIEELQKDIAEREGFKVLRHKLEIYGICRECSLGEGRGVR